MNRLLVLVFVVALFSCGEKKEELTVRVLDRQILLNDVPYLIKGVCYHPVALGNEKRSFETLSGDLKLMKEAGVNTIRVYEPILEKEVLDEIDAAGIKVIIGFGYNQGGNFDILSGSFVDYIQEYKSHNAILFWELGNEYNYHPNWFEDDMANWYEALNDAALKTKKADVKRPVATAHGELPDSLALAMCPDLDIWGMNVYRWDNPEPLFAEWEKVSTKPMYFSEAGADSYMTIEKSGYKQGVNEKAQADATKNILEETFRNQDICSGLTLFAFVDEFWKAGNPNQQDPGGWAPNSSGVPYDGAPNEEYWGILTIERNKKLAFDVVKEFYLKN